MRTAFVSGSFMMWIGISLLSACSNADTSTGDSAQSDQRAAGSGRFETAVPEGVEDVTVPRITTDAAAEEVRSDEEPDIAGADPEEGDSAGPTGCDDGSPSQCASASLLVTCIEGEYVSIPCGPDEVCMQGACTPTECTPFETRVCLDEETAGLCNEAGTGFDPLPCPPNYTCDPSIGVCLCESPLQILFVLDASGSMGMTEYAIDGVTRWEHARTAIANVMADYPNMRYGLKTFPEEPVVCGAPGCASQGGCAPEASDEVNALPGAPPEVLNTYLAERALAAPGSQLPLVLTPLVNAFDSLANANSGGFASGDVGPRYIVLISDGEDTCYAPHAPELIPGVVGQSVASLRDAQSIYTYAVGFGLESGSAQLAAVAQQGGTGQAEALLATDGDELSETLSELLALIDPKQCFAAVDDVKPPACGATGTTDADEDGWCSDLDCADGNAAVYPGATEVTNGVDDDCDGDTDEPDGFIPPVPESEGCKGIDFLFVIDNSGSMGDEQEELVASFPGFITAIQANVPTGDYHIMVVDSDATGISSGSSSMGCSNINGVKTCTCAPAPDCCDDICQDPLWGPSTTCNGAPACDQPPPPELSTCDNTLGAGRTYNGYYDECFVAPPRFVTSGQPNLSETFSCMGLVGVGGDGGERVMQAMAEAVTPPLSASGGCNAGFLRSDAILVVTFITDEPESSSIGTVTSWKQALVNAKNGNEEAVYVLGVFSDDDLPNSLCGGSDPAPQLRSFVESFDERGQACSICQSSYTTCFAEAVGGIKTTCDNFVVE